MKKMKKIMLSLLLTLTPVAAYAGPTLSWDTVTTGADNLPLSPGAEVKTYDVYRCPVNVNPCLKTNATKIGTVPAAVPITPRQGFDLAGQVFPANFMVTATNIIAESAESVTVKATPADRPKNLLLGQ